MSDISNQKNLKPLKMDQYLSPTDIAQAMNLASSTVREHLHRAMCRGYAVIHTGRIIRIKKEDWERYITEDMGNTSSNRSKRSKPSRHKK